MPQDYTFTNVTLLRLLAAQVSALPVVKEVINQKDEALIAVLGNGQRFAITVSGPASEKRADVKPSAKETSVG